MVPWGADMFRGVPGSMNIQLNQALADLQARSTMWNVPTFGFDFNSYPNMPYTGIEGLLNPQYTWNQQMWNNAANGSLGMGCVGSGIGAFGRNFGNFGMSNPFTSPWNASTGDSSSTDPDTKKYNKLLNFLKKLNDYVQNDTSAHILTSAQKDRLDELAKHGSKEKDMKDKYNELKEFYDGLNSSDIQYFLEFGSTKLSINGKNNGATLYESLVNSGFEYSDTAIDKADLAGNVNAKLKAISKEDFNLASVLDDVKSYGALDFLSSYYSKYKAGTDDDIIELFFKAVKNAGKNNKESVKNDFKVLITELINQSKEIATEIGGSTKDEINKIANELDKAYSNFDKNKIKEYFRQLYTISRIAAAKNLENTLKETYGEIDPKLFSNNSFITQKTEEDLKQEGLSSEYNKLKNKVKVKSVDDSKGSKDTGSSSSTDWSELDVYAEDVQEILEKDASARTSEEQGKLTDARQNLINKLADSKVIETYSPEKKVTYKNNPYVVYKVCGQNDKYVIVTNELKLVEIGSDFKCPSEAAELKASTFANKYNTEANNDDKSDDKQDRMLSGAEVYTKLHGRTADREYYKINNTLSQLDEKNVLEFLESYYDKSGYTDKSNEGIIEQMDDEYDDGRLEMDNKKNLIKTFLKVAKNKGLANDPDYKLIEDLIHDYENDEDLSKRKNFNTNDTWIGYGWFNFCCTNHNEVIDRAMYRLYKKIKGN